MPSTKAISEGCGCEGCPFVDGMRGPVYDRVTSDRLAVVLPAPTSLDVRLGRIASGFSGEVINGRCNSPTIASATLCNRPEGSVELTIKDWYYANRSKISRGKIANPMARCNARLKASIVKARVIVTLGPIAMRAVAATEGVRIGKVKAHDAKNATLAAFSLQRGHPFLLPSGRWLLPTFDLDELRLGQRHLIHVASDDLERARWKADRKW